jgi:hypothetical protein
MKLISFLAAFFFVSSTFAADASTCPEKYEIFDNQTQLQMMLSGNNCYVSVHPRDAFENMIYRDYSFTSDGQFMVFDSYGEGPESQTTAAREFFFFPRMRADLSYKYDAASKRLSVTAPSGKVFLFNTEKAILISISGTTIQQNFTIKPQNKGGLEIVANDGLYMDGGFKLGQSPSQNPKNKLIFYDTTQKSCELANGDLYRYTADDDAIFKFDDLGLTTFLGQRCPQLAN